MNERCGAEHPEVVDLITERAGVCYLYLLQEGELEGEMVLVLQQKLNSYLSFILDGQLQRTHPASAHHGKIVRIVLRHAPSQFIDQFLERVKPLFAESGVGLEVVVEPTSHDA